jgi:hypothetical protein
MKESCLPVQQKRTRTDGQNIFDLTGSEKLDPSWNHTHDE